jgi:carboxypeptidase family protein
MFARMMKVLLLLPFAFATLLFGQGGANGTIVGTVTDSSGAVVANAKVDVMNTATGVVVHTETSSTGDYTVPYLNPASYKISVTAPGFQKAESTPFTLVVGQQARVNISMKPGSTTEVVEVTTSSVGLQTESPEISNTIAQKQIEELPLNGRNFVQLLTLGEGAVTIGGEQGTMRQGQGDAISINGGRPTSNNYTLDGLVNTDTSLNTPAVILSQDAIQEFKTQSGAYSAEYGFSANQVNIVSKSGTNQIHGTVFETNRNDAFDAKSHFQPTTPELRQNQFGFVVGGPAYIPKLYDGRNKTFWLVNYEGWRIRNGYAASGNAPDPRELTGDFSQSNLPAFGSAACNAALTQNQPCMPVDPTTGLPFPGNIIPSSSFSRVAQVTAPVSFAAPNANPAATGGNNLVLQGALPLTSNQQTYRLDQNLGRWGRIFGRGTYSTYQNSSLGSLAPAPVGLGFFNETSKSWTVSHTINIGQTAVNNFRFGFLRAIALQTATAPSSSAVSGLGLSGTFTKFSSGQESWPNIAISQFSAFGGPINAYTASNQPMWEFADSVTLSRGAHTISLGVDYRRWHLIRNLDNDFFGEYTYRNDLISSNAANCPNATGLCGTGNAVADYLLGYYSGAGGFFPAPLSSTKEAGNPQDHVFSYFAPYVQDDWKVSNRLTLNIGLRWDYRAAAYEASNHFFWLDNKNPQGGLCYADKTLSSNGVAPAGNGVYEYCGSNVPHPGSKTPFAPRFGFAYRPFGEKTVIRGGYGIFWDSSEGREIDDSGDLYPYAVRQSLSPAQNPNVPKLTNGLFPSFTALNPIDPASLTFLAVIESDNPLNPYLQQWNISIQHQLARNTVLEVNYIGNKGTHLLDRRNIAQALPPSAADLPFCQANPNDATHNCLVSQRKPYANFPGIYINSDWHGYSNYNAGTVKLEHRTPSLALTAFYTWAKSMDNKSAAAGIGATAGTGWQGFMDNHNPDLDYGQSDFSVKHRFVASYVYQLPIGRGKHVLGNMNRVADALIGGWQLSGVTTFQTGFPYGIQATDVNGLLNTFNQRADMVCDPNHGFTKSVNEWFNTACFVNPPPGVYGTTHRNFLTGPGINNWDMGLAKTFRFSERVGFQLRADTFNTFNHTQYGVAPGGLIGFGSGGGNNPGATLGSPTFGKITSAMPGRIMQLGGKITF